MPRQDACLEKDRIVADCVHGYCDELLIADGKENRAGAAALLDVDPVTLRRALRDI